MCIVFVFFCLFCVRESERQGNTIHLKFTMVNQLIKINWLSPFTWHSFIFIYVIYIIYILVLVMMFVCYQLSFGIYLLL